MATDRLVVIADGKLLQYLAVAKLKHFFVDSSLYFGNLKCLAAVLRVTRPELWLLASASKGGR